MSWKGRGYANEPQSGDGAPPCVSSVCVRGRSVCKSLGVMRWPWLLHSHFFRLPVLDMPPQMDYFYQEARVPPVCVDQGHEHARAHEHAPDSDPEPVISCMLVGDGAVGKTSMIISYTNNGYPADYKQTAFDVFSGESFLCTPHTAHVTNSPKPHRSMYSLGVISSPSCSLGQVQVDGEPVRIQLMDTAGQVSTLCWVTKSTL